MRIHIKFGDTNHVVEISTDATLGDLREKVRDATRVLPPMQKLLGKPNLQTKPEDSLLSELGIRDGTKLMLIGNQVADVVEANRASAVEQQHESKQVQLRLRLPHHVWMLSPYASALADAYVDGRGAPLEGGGHLLSLLALDLILTRINRLGVASTAGSAQLLAAMGNEGAAQIRHPFLASFSDQHSVALQYVHRIVRRCYEFTAAATGAQEPGAIREVVDRCIRDIDSLSVGEWLLLPAGWVGQTSSNYCFLLLHRVTSEKYTVVVMNRGRDGQEYHPRWATAEKIRVSPILHLDGVHRERVVDHGFWLTLLSLWMRGNDPQDQSEFIRAEVFYDVLLPWLVEHGAHQENFETRGASEALFPWAADATATAAPYPKSVTQQGCSTICSASSAMKGAMTAACFLAGRLGEMTPAEVKQLKFALKYELFVRAAEDVHNYAKRFVVNESLSFPSRVKSVPGSLTQDGASNVVDQQRLCRAMSSLVAAGVKDTASGINLRDVLSAAGEQGVVLTQANHVLLSTDSLMNKMVFVYIGSLSVPECATFTALVADVVPCLARAVLRGAPPVEILFVSADQTRELYDQHAAMLPCSRAGFSPVALLQSLDCSKVPEMIAFGPDGALLHRDGVQALRADPEALLFPHGPWRAANPLSATDVRMLEVSSAQLAHHTNRRLSNGAITEDVGQQILRLVEAVKDVVDALPQDDIRDWTSTSATGRPNDAHKSHGSSDCIESQDPTSLDTLLTSTVLNSRDNGYPECSLLPTVSTARYCGNLFHTTPGTADDLTELTIPQSLRDLHRVLVHCKMIVSRLWARAGDSGTSSRVAVEMQLIEFISWAFMELIPVPGVGTGATVGADPLGSATRSVSADFYETDSFEWAQLSAEEDPQLETLAAIHYLLLSFGNAWQAVETPSRSADAERCLVSMEMLLVFDAVVRQVNGSRGGQQLALLLASDGGYYLSTTLGKRNLPFATVAASLELTRPRLLLVRACMLRYINHQHACFQHELYDLRMPDKLEIRRGSRTITFLRTFMDNLGYSIDDAGGQRGAQGSEMEKLMEWLCSDRTPLASKNPEFLLVRDVVLLAKFLGTMERREAQLLNRRKELDHFASWRICFEEDTPGRQMSAGWRTSPTSLQWECLMVRGRDLDVADITVHGFGRRELLYGEGLVLCSPIDVGRLLGIDRPTEDDVLHARQLPNLGGGTMNIEEVEVVLSCLTTPYLRIPLLLDFFSTQDRHTYLFLPPVQALLRAVLFEPADFVLPERLLQADPREVPMRLSAAQREEIERQHLHGDFHRHIDEDCLGTTYGLLLNELANAPSTVLQPVSRLVDSVKELGPSSVYSANASYVLFVVELVTGVLNFVRFSVEHRTSSEVSTMHHFHTELLQSLESVVLPLLTAWLEESVGNLDTPSQCVVYAYQSMVVRALWKGAVLNLGGTSSWGDASNLPTVARHITRLLRCSAFVRARHGFGMGMQRTQLAAQEGDNELSAEDKLLRFLQAHGLNTSRATPQLLEQGKQLMMSGGRRRAVFLQIIGQHTRDTVRLPNLFRSDPSSTTESKRLKLPPADLPELELFQVLHEDHRDIMSWMEGLSSEDLSTLLSSVVQTVLCDVDGSSPTSSGHLTSHGSSSGFAHFDATAEELWTREQPGCYASSSRSGLAFHLQSCELFWHHDELRPVPDSMSHFTDFENILGKDLLQCGLVSRHEHRHWVHIVGTPYDVVEWTSPPEATDQGVHHPIILSGDWPGEMARSAAFEGDIFDRPVEVMSPDPWPVRAERWAVELVKCVYAASYPHGVQFAPLAMALPEDTTGATETECDEMHFLYNDAPQYPKNPENATWKEIVAYRRPQPHFHVFNLVPHARKMYRSLVYSTNQRLCLHSLALMGRERRRDALQSTAFVAGELKRRISVDTTLEIHRHNATLGGRETYVPAALLQGLVPSALLEAFYIWQGDDDLLRGYHMPQQRNALSDAALSAPESEEHDHWFNYSVEIHLRGTGEAQSLSHCTVVRRNDRSYTPISQLGNSTEGVVGATSSMSEEAADPALIALLHRAMPHIPQAVCAAILERSKAMDIAGAIAWARSSDHQAEVEALVSDHRLPEGANHVAAAPGTRADDLILVNLLQWPHLAPLLAILTQLEDCSHVLVWARRCASLSLGDQLSKTVVTSDESGGEGNLYIDHIDLPRLRARFEVRRDGANSRLRMFLADQPGWRLAEADDAGAWSAPRLNVLRAPFQQCVVLVNSTHETTLLVPNHDFSPVEVREDPFCPLLLFDRSSFTWREAVPSPFYLYPVHPSHGFLQPPTLAASLYYAVMQCATQHYVGAIRTLEACYTDCPFSAEEAFMAALFERTMTDRFPDAHAVRLKLAHAVQYSTNTYEWPLVAELHGYLEKKRHVRADCRLSRSELVEVLKRCDKSSPLPKAQLELLAALIRAESAARRVDGDIPTSCTAIIGTPSLQRCGHPWEQLLVTRWEHISPQKLKRLTFRFDPSQLEDDALVSFIWGDKLLSDEENGGNRKLGFYFLYALHKQHVSLRLGEADVTSTLSQLWSRWFHLRHARWGREAAAGNGSSSEDSTVPPSWSATVLQLMELFPTAAWPAMAPPQEQFVLANGINLQASAMDRDGHPIQNLQFAQARRSTFPDLFEAIHHVARELHTISSFTEMRRVQIQASWRRIPTERDMAVHMYDHVRGRVLPQNSALTSVSLGEASLGHSSLGQLLGQRPGGLGQTLIALCEEPMGELQLLGPVIHVSMPEAVNEEESGQDGSEPLPFDLRRHHLARPPLAQGMLDRLSEDAARYQHEQRHTVRYTLCCLSEKAVESLLTSPQDSEVQDALAEAWTAVQEIVDRCTQLGKMDSEAVEVATRSVLSMANRPASTEEADALSVLRHRLQVVSKDCTNVTLEWLCGAALSTELGSDLNAINPHHGPVEALRMELVMLMLLSNRVYFCEQSVAAAQSLLLFLELCGLLRGHRIPSEASRDEESEAGFRVGLRQRVHELVQHFSLELAPDDLLQADGSILSLPQKVVELLTSRLHQLQQVLMDVLTARRHYSAKEAEHVVATTTPAGVVEAVSRTVDPRFVLFEFVFNIMLRARQVEMVRWFVANLQQGQSRVQQMIMGQGKTTVVGPLLALILADGKQLVTQVMPTALLEQTRGILRRCFSAVLVKHIYTLQFDRSMTDGGAAGGGEDGIHLLFHKLKSAEEDGSVVIAAPECIKAVFLKCMEQLHLLESVSTSDLEATFAVDERDSSHRVALRETTVERGRVADAIFPILDLWRRGVLMMDEVDVLLHPLRSELNFPIGMRHPMDMSGPRWRLPMHLLDAMFFSKRGRACEDPQRHLTGSPGGDWEMGSSEDPQRQELRTATLRRISEVIDEGFACRALQREPHLVLLDPQFYHDRLLPALLPWVQLWLYEYYDSELPKQVAARSGICTWEVFRSHTDEFLTQPRICGGTPVATYLNLHLPADVLKLLVLAHDWLHRLLPHVIAKIDRVSFGVLQPTDLAMTESATDGSMPYSRRMMAVPFVAKDVPSRSSEFAHPDVVLGLTILAFRYEGLRKLDVHALLVQLKQDFSRQSGPKAHRPAAKLYQHWLRLSSLEALPVDEHGASHRLEQAGVPLSQLQLSDHEQMDSLWHLLRRVPEVVHYYLCSCVFPRTMNFQHLKVSACGHELGSSLLFTRRLGFSGTPSSLLPIDLGECLYEPGSDGRVLSVLTNPHVVQVQDLPEQWTPLHLLDRIAAAQPSFSALIDAGALITNMRNDEVARYLLARLPSASFDGVTYLDNQDRQMIVLRAHGLVVPVAQCGVPLSRRFTFFDQVHTTGTDVKQCATATAVLTLGKDLVFRDYAQAAYRMRGIGRGQKLCLYLIPEVRTRVEQVLGEGFRSGDLLRDVPAWLLLNSMRVEGMQFHKLSLQEVANVWRKKALRNLVADATYAASHADLFNGFLRSRRFQLPRPASAVVKEDFSSLPSVAVLQRSIQEFRESIDFPLPSTIATPPTLADQLHQGMAERPAELLEGDDAAHSLVQRLLDRMLAAVHLSSTTDGEARHELDTMDLNAEVVHEQEAEQEQEQEAEQEEQKVMDFCRDDETQIPWSINTLRSCGADAEKTRQPSGGSCFYQLRSMQIRPTQPQLAVDEHYLLSDNYFRSQWHGVGERRLKNAFIFVEWVPVDALVPPTGEADVALTSTTTGHVVNRADNLLAGLVTLAEGETLRWMLHHSAYVRGSQGLALRFVSSGRYLDRTALFATMIPHPSSTPLPESREVAGNVPTRRSSSLPPSPAALLFRFLNNDMYYSEAELRTLEGALAGVPPSDRLEFFVECLRLRRRHRNHWEDAPIAALFVLPEDKPFLRQITRAKRMQLVLREAVEVLVRPVESLSAVEKERATRMDERLHNFALRVSEVRMQGDEESGTEEVVLARDLSELLLDCFSGILGGMSSFDVQQALLAVAAADSAGLEAISLLKFFDAFPSLDSAHVVEWRAAAMSLAGGASRSAHSASLPWNCPTCTYLNDPSTSMCVMCMVPRPGGAPKEEDGPWQCTSCTFINESRQMQLCSVCLAPNPSPLQQEKGTMDDLGMGSWTCPEGYWTCAVEQGGCSKFNLNSFFYCQVCEKARPNLASIRF